MIRSMPPTTIAVLHGDQTGEELLREALRLLEPGVFGIEVETRDFDLSLEERRRTRNQCVLDAAQSLRELGFGIKAATVTPEGSGDVGSPNAILRTCRIVAEYAFQHARRIEAKVFGGPKFTVSPVYEGMFKEELDAAAARQPEVRYEPHLIDATYALLLATTGEALVIPALNRDGDTLSDLVMQMFGTIAGAESTLLAFDEGGTVSVAMTEAPHGTAPALQGKNIANPMAMILAVASLLGYMKGEEARRASHAVYESALEAVSDGVRTADLGGHTSTTDFTNEVIRRVKTKVDGWSALADIGRWNISPSAIRTWSYVPAAADFGGKDRVATLTGVFNAVAEREARIRNFMWVDIREASTSGIGSAGWIASDDLHPGDAQYAAWAEVIWPAVSALMR